MKTYIKILLVIAATFSAVGCEKDWNKYESDNLEMNLFILAEADGPISGVVRPVLDYLCDLTGRFFEYTPSSVSVTNAVIAHYSINGGEKVLLEKTDRNSRFLSQTELKAGDRIDIELSGYYYKPAKASVVIPDKPQVEYESMGVETIDDNKYHMIKVKIKDNAAKNNYYMLKSRSKSIDSVDIYYRKNNELYHSYSGTMTSSAFTSKDEIFKDPQVKRKPFGMPDNFSSVFSDKLFNGKEYEFIIGCPINMVTSAISNSEFYSVIRSVENTVTITISELSEDYYNYSKMYEHTDKSNGVVYFSNVDGGFGLFGAINSAKPVTFEYNEK